MAEARNRLAEESSPYLLLHRNNPVDWYPWGEEALGRAEQEDRPIFLSVGYSTCYWCHVMERESFSDPAIASLMNEGFVNVKVDREERPEIDEIYMAATQLLTGQGGWPNSVFLTPELKPFYAGTYFPPTDRYGRPGFPSVVRSLAEAWRGRRDEIRLHAEEVEAALRRLFETGRGEPAAVPPPQAAERALASLAQVFDAEHGGFGGAPKFPTPANLFLLLDFADESRQAARMLETTLDAMGRGGLFDQVGGGFHRYATDRGWRIPHFEKMLYDNALLLEVYAGQHGRTGEAEAARVVRRTVAFLERELVMPEGGFRSALDAETEGQEGRYYAWSREEIEAALTVEESTFAAPLLGFAGSPFFEGDLYVLHLPRPVGELAAERGVSTAELWERLEPICGKLLAARESRARPAVDDKVLTDWNGLAIAGLAEAGRWLGEPRFLELAARAAGFVLQHLRPAGGPLLHSWRQGEAKLPAYLADYAFLSRGLLALHRASGEDRWLRRAAELTDEQIERLEDRAIGGFFGAAERPDLLVRPKEVHDGALPAANAVAILNLLELSERTGETRWRAQAGRCLGAFANEIDGRPEAARMLSLAARRYRGLGWGQTAGEEEAVEAAATIGEPRDGWAPIAVQLRIAEGWHVYSHQPGADWAPATVLAGEGVELRGIDYPPGEPLAEEGEGEALSVYRGELTITGELRAGAQQPRLELRLQPCSEAFCSRPRSLSLPLAGP